VWKSYGVHFDGSSLKLRNYNCFPSIVLKSNGTLYWNISNFWNNIKIRIEKGRSLNPLNIGIDTWRIDFSLLDENDSLLDKPVIGIEEPRT
jgi:rhamnulokinase